MIASNFQLLLLLVLLSGGNAVAQPELFIESGSYIEGERQAGQTQIRKEWLPPPRVIPGLGARAGVMLHENVFAAVEGRYDPSLSFNQATRDSGMLPFDVSPTVGWTQLDQRIRIWGSFLLGNSYWSGRSQTADLRFAERLGYRLGAGLRIASVDLKLEYQEMHENSSGGRLGRVESGWSGQRTFNEQSWIASASFALEP